MLRRFVSLALVVALLLGTVNTSLAEGHQKPLGDACVFEVRGDESWSFLTDLFGCEKYDITSLNPDLSFLELLIGPNKGRKLLVPCGGQPSAPPAQQPAPQPQTPAQQPAPQPHPEAPAQPAATQPPSQSGTVNINGRNYLLASHLGQDAEGWFGSSFCGNGQIVKVYQGSCEPWYPSEQPPQSETVDPSQSVDAGAIMPSMIPGRECDNFRSHIMQGGANSHWNAFGGDTGTMAVLAASIATERVIKGYVAGNETMVSVSIGGRYLFLKWGTGNATAYWADRGFDYIRGLAQGSRWKEITSPKAVNQVRRQIEHLMNCYRSQVPVPVVEPAPQPVPIGTPAASSFMTVPVMGQHCLDGSAIREGQQVEVRFFGMQPVSEQDLATLVAAGVVVLVVITVVASGGASAPAVPVVLAVLL